jgi:hypothetical protein
MHFTNNRVSLPHNNYTILLLSVSGRRCLVYLALCLGVLSCFGQKYDYLWLIGLAGGPAADSQYTLWSVTQFDFSTDPVNVYRRYRPIDMSCSSIAGCNSAGVLQFYTNCMQINNVNDEVMPNGAGLSPGPVADMDTGTSYAYRSNRAATIIPKPNNDSIYYLMYTAWDYDSLIPEGGFYNYFYYSVINMNEDNGLGTVVDENHVLVNDSIIGGGGMVACKHANGRDWWVFMPKMFTNCVYQFLITSDGIDSLGLQCVGDTFAENTDRGSSCFTPDGSKYIWCNPYDGLHILDFDRCSGQLSNSRYIPVSDSAGQIFQNPLFDGVSVSPNSEYLYVSTGSELWQFNLAADNIAQSKLLIDNIFQSDSITSTMFAQLAPDGRIYINPIGGDTFFHVINAPDSLGSACHFQINGLRTPTLHWNCMPLYPITVLVRLRAVYAIRWDWIH